MHTGRDAIEFDCEQFGGIETLGPQVSLPGIFIVFQLITTTIYHRVGIIER